MTKLEDRKHLAMVAYAHEKSRRRQEHVVRTIRKMEREGIPISFEAVSLYARCSKSFLYRNQELSEIIRLKRKVL